MLKDGDKGAILQRDKATYAVAPHHPCGVVTPDTLRRLADVADKYGCQALKITSAARIALIGLKEDDIDAAWADLDLPRGAAVGLCVRSVKACPGTTYCKYGQQDSLGIGMKLDEKYHGVALPGKMKMGVSGCNNQCAETCIKDVGLVGKRSGWVVLVGGKGAAKPVLAQELVSGLDDEQALACIDKILEWYRQNAEGKERLNKTIDRVGIESLRAAAAP
jgi:NAD(P)H-nitrite reductase large subunit